MHTDDINKLNDCISMLEAIKETALGFDTLELSKDAIYGLFCILGLVIKKLESVSI